jgi:hypothetical protein
LTATIGNVAEELVRERLGLAAFNVRDAKVKICS